MPTDISDFLSPADALVDLDATDKSRLLRDLATHAASAVGLTSGVIASELSKREALGSTGIGGGVALPHARLADLARPYGILARLKEPIDFSSVDDRPVDIVFVLLLPANLDTEHLNALACVARKLHDPSTLLSIRSATNSAALYQSVTTQ